MIILYGRPTTKKNSSRVVKCGKFTKVLPSKAYEVYEKECLWQLKQCSEQYEGPVHVVARYWMPNKAHWPDLTGLMQATADILEKAQIIDNDRNIRRWCGTEIVGIDKDRPRCEITIKEVC